MKKLVKLYGERNTNTNYFSKLIGLNLDVEQLPGVVHPFFIALQEKLPGREAIRDVYFDLTERKNFGWKHTHVGKFSQQALNSRNKNDIAFITITKNPYSWLLSLYNRPYHQYYAQKLSFEAFLQAPWKVVRRDNLGSDLSNPIQLWNAKNASYFELDKLSALHFTTESIFQDATLLIDKIGSQFDIRKISDEFIGYDRSTKESGKDTSFYKDYYLHEQWKDKLSPEAVRLINASLDEGLMERFGYEVL
jgi:hypothetical protein